VRTLRVVVAVLSVVVLARAPLLAQQLQSAGQVTVAVFPMNGFMLNADGSQLGNTFRSMIITELGNAANLKLVEREELDRILTAQEISVSGIVTDDRAVQIGRLIGAQYAVTGSITIDARNARLDLRMIDIETSQVVSKPFKEMVPKDELLGLVSRVATDFAGSAKVTQRVADVVVPPAAMLAYARGLDYEARGEKQQAAKMFQTALDLFPQHPHARAALDRVN